MLALGGGSFADAAICLHKPISFTTAYSFICISAECSRFFLPLFRQIQHNSLKDYKPFFSQLKKHTLHNAKSGGGREKEKEKGGFRVISKNKQVSF